MGHASGARRGTDRVNILSVELGEGGFGAHPYLLRKGRDGVYIHHSLLHMSI